MFCHQNSAFAFASEVEMVGDGGNIASGTETEREREIPKEPLFEKPLTPSDVGKLNRLVIPKQHAEKCFPLNANSGENGLLLNFEDEVGKPWRFRYSYWNSSQSYVLTKGWSRFVKEKRLDAGDTVIFARHPADPGRFFIGWRRRSVGGGQDSTNLAQPVANGGGWSRVFHSGHPYRSQHQGPSSLPHHPDHCLHAGSAVQNQSSSGNSKRLRLFGVNLECMAEEPDPPTPLGSPMSNQGRAHQHSYHQCYYDHKDVTFSGADAYRQG